MRHYFGGLFVNPVADLNKILPWEGYIYNIEDKQVMRCLYGMIRAKEAEHSGK